MGNACSIMLAPIGFGQNETSQMRRRLIYLIVIMTLTSCLKENKSDNDFIEKVIDLTIETASGEYVQLPDLYDSLASKIPKDNDERMILVEKLKARGFKITNWGRGNIPPLGPRIVDVELMSGHCICEVTKTYYSTTVDTLYQMTEGMKCKRMTVN
jgi:hypothetical protein